MPKGKCVGGRNDGKIVDIPDDHFKVTRHGVIIGVYRWDEEEKVWRYFEL